MNGINPYSGLTSSTASPNAQALGQADFLKLMTIQMTHQDPTKPMQNGEFLSQMAQFGTVAGIQDLQNAFHNFSALISSNQALQASSLVGHYVSVPSDQGFLPAGGKVKGHMDLPANAENVTVKIIDAKTGETIREINLGSHSAGAVPFVWDGHDSSGALAPPGTYKLEATATIDGKNTALTTQVHAKVESVILGNAQEGIKLNLEGLGSIGFNEITQVL